MIDGGWSDTRIPGSNIRFKVEGSGGNNTRVITVNVVIVGGMHAIFGLLIRSFLYPIIKELSSSFVSRRKVVA
jgi:branched-subunit amino acid ABC-type transport system permease component